MPIRLPAGCWWGGGLYDESLQPWAKRLPGRVPAGGGIALRRPGLKLLRDVLKLTRRFSTSRPSRPRVSSVERVSKFGFRASDSSSPGFSLQISPNLPATFRTCRVSRAITRATMVTPKVRRTPPDWGVRFAFILLFPKKVSNGRISRQGFQPEKEEEGGG
jgi:hypothetical protein